MKTTRQLTAIIEREDDVDVALCPELDIASQGDTVESARRNLVEALELFFESADPTEVSRRRNDNDSSRDIAPATGAIGRKRTQADAKAGGSRLSISRRLANRSRFHAVLPNPIPRLPLSPPVLKLDFPKSFGKNDEEHDSLCLSRTSRHNCSGVFESLGRK
jgi:predicted RNase H-like HicB family nuclease